MTLALPLPPLWKEDVMAGPPVAILGLWDYFKDGSYRLRMA